MKNQLKVFFVIISLVVANLRLFNYNSYALVKPSPSNFQRYNGRNISSYVFNIAIHDYGYDFTSRKEKYGAKVYVTPDDSNSAITVNQDVSLQLDLFSSSNPTSVFFTITTGSILSNEIQVLSDHPLTQSDVVGYVINPTTYNNLYLSISGNISSY